MSSSDESNSSDESSSDEEFLRGRMQAGPAKTGRFEQEIAVLRRLASSNASMLFSDKFSDVVLESASGERIPAHRNILAANSKCMDKLLSGKWAESASRVVRMEQTATAVKALLRFLYTGQVDDAALGSDLGGVLELAKKHEQEYLVAACEQHALMTLTVKSVVTTFVLASFHNMVKLEAACVKFIKKNTLAATFSKAYKQLVKEQPAMWIELRAAVGLPEEESEDEDEENFEGRAKKIPCIRK